MCLILFSWRSAPRPELLIAANRDEFYERPTSPLHPWGDESKVYAGRDLLSGGTWMGVTARARFAAITNYRHPLYFGRAGPSRGHLVRDFLQGNQHPRRYIHSIVPRAREYNGFNLLLADGSEMWWYSNVENIQERLEPGVHGLSNALLDTPWPKVVAGKQALKRSLSTSRKGWDARMLDFLTSTTRAKDADLPDTGIGLERERSLSPPFVQMPDDRYGTRCSTLAKLGGEGPDFISEVQYDEKGNADGTVTFKGLGG